MGKQKSVGGSCRANGGIDSRVVLLLHGAGDAQVKGRPSGCVCHSDSVHTAGRMSTVALDQGLSRSALVTSGQDQRLSWGILCITGHLQHPWRLPMRCHEHPPVVATQSVSRHCSLSPGGHSHPWLDAVLGPRLCGSSVRHHGLL